MVIYICADLMKDFPFFFDSPSELYVQRMECVP
jgi:hypothetical protein